MSGVRSQETKEPSSGSARSHEAGAGTRSSVEVGASDSTNTLREILEFVRLEIEDGHGLILTHGEAAVLMAEFDRRRDPQDRVPPHCQTCQCWRGA